MLSTEFSSKNFSAFQKHLLLWDLNAACSKGIYSWVIYSSIYTEVENP